MKVESLEPNFNPVVITIESRLELEWVLACLNRSINSAEKAAHVMGINLDIDKIDLLGIDMKFYELVRDQYKKL